MTDLNNSLDTSKVIKRTLTESQSSVSINPDDVKNSNQMVGSDETISSTKSIVESLVKVFPAGLPEGVVVNRLMSVYHIEKDVAQACYQAALEEVSEKSKLTKQEIQTNASALISGEDKKKDGMANLNAWGDYQKTLLNTSTSASTQGGD